LFRLSGKGDAAWLRISGAALGAHPRFRRIRLTLCVKVCRACDGRLSYCCTCFRRSASWCFGCERGGARDGS
jgi:hypothetical protein